MRKIEKKTRISAWKEEGVLLEAIGKLLDMCRSPLDCLMAKAREPSHHSA
jgi:DNA-binding transcriptional MerR regulator